MTFHPLLPLAGHNRTTRTVPFFVACTLAFLLAGAQAALQRAPSPVAIPLTPPVQGFLATNAFGSLRFTNPVAIVTAPGDTRRLYVVEQRGRIVVIPDVTAPTPVSKVFMDMSARVVGGVPSNEQGLLGLAFHPGFATNRQFFVTYTSTASGSPNRLSRFLAAADDPEVGRLETEVVFISQRDEAPNHNGGAIEFGPDGYLYVSFGDEGGANDQFNNAQRIDRDFFAGIIRIDVDKRPGNLAPNPHAASSDHYRVPADNPFVGATTFNGVAVNPAAVRTEFWAVGLRNPWRMSFDRATGLLYCADVGQNRLEEIVLITRGGNFGWAFREGNSNGPKSASTPAGFTQIAPLHQYAHGSATNQGNSVTGGVVYRGTRLSQLDGAYIFSDYVSGNVWALRHQGSQVTSVVRLFGESSIAGFGIDPSNGDILLASQSKDTLLRIVYDGRVSGSPLPTLLSNTGAFADLASLTPATGLVPYELNVPFWSDNAIKRRWFGLPAAAPAFGFRTTDPWTLPSGAVWVKHFDMEMTNGVPSSRRRLETRFLIKNNTGIHGLTYRWDTAQTDAVLVPEEGADEVLTLREGAVNRSQVWRYPSRSECLRCHTPEGGFALGFSTAQLNRTIDHGDGPADQLRALAAAGYLDSTPPPAAELPALRPAGDLASSREIRVRSYLAANCAQCHVPGGPGLGLFDARASVPTSQAGLVDGALRGGGSVSNAAVVVRGAPAQSELLRRLTLDGPGRMPPLASTVLDQEAIRLISEWISQDLPGHLSFTEWQARFFGSTNSVEAGPAQDPDRDGRSNEFEFVSRTDPKNATDAWTWTIERSANGVTLRFPRLANRETLIEFADSLEHPVVWRRLDSPQNLGGFPATDGIGEVAEIPAGTGARYYRARLAMP